MKNFDLISIIAALFAVMVVYNVANGSFHLVFSGQPIAHSQHLWNILGMYVVGFAAVLAGGCPLRQLILAGQGSSDSAVTFLGMLIGAAFAHNFGLVGAAAKAATETEPAVAGGPQNRRDRLHCRAVCHCGHQSAPQKDGKVSRKRRMCNG